MKFEWDKNKNEKNIKKHSISFEETKTVFDDGSSIEFEARKVDFKAQSDENTDD